MLITCKLWRIWVFLPWIKTTSSLVLELWVDTLNYHPFSCFLWVMGWQFNFRLERRLPCVFTNVIVSNCGESVVFTFTFLQLSSTSCAEVPHLALKFPRRHPILPQFAAPDIGLVIEFVVWWRRYSPQCLNESIFSGAIVNTENIPKHMGKKHPNSLWFFYLKTEGLERFSHQEITPISGWSNPGKFTLRLISFVCHDLIHMRKNADMYWFPKLVPELGRHLVKGNRFLVGSFPHIPLWNRVLRAFPYFFGCLRTLPNFPNITW